MGLQDAMSLAIRNGIGTGRWSNLFHYIIDKHGYDLMMGPKSKQHRLRPFIPLSKITEQKNEASRSSRFENAIKR